MAFGRGNWAGWALAGMTAAALPALAQYPGQIQPKDKDAPSLRAVAVVEWTGDLDKPKASRVIPVSIWDGQQLQDAGIYLAQPEPMALEPEVEYELQQDGKKAGFFDIKNSAETQGMWIGSGVFKPLPKMPTAEELARIHANIKIDEDDEDSDKPILHRKHHDDDGSSGTQAKAPAPDPDRPTLHGESGSDDSANPAGPAPDPDRPRLHEDTASSADPDRPKLSGGDSAGDDEAHVSSVAKLSDPDRPTLKRGIPEGYGPEVKPSLMGLPPEMKQEVAVSDPRPIKDHPWDFSWANPDDQRKMKEALEDEARKALGLEQPAPEPAPAPKRLSAKGSHSSAVKPKREPQPAETAELVDEQFRVFELTYGGGATMVFSAHTDGTGADQKFVTLIAQPDLYGSVVVLVKNVTDGAHLDIKPRLRLVDAVDAMGDNRGELLFELRGQNQRQFTLYRVLRGQATQIFTTGAVYFGSAGE